MRSFKGCVLAGILPHLSFLAAAQTNAEYDVFPDEAWRLDPPEWWPSKTGSRNSDKEYAIVSLSDCEYVIGNVHGPRIVTDYLEEDWYDKPLRTLVLVSGQCHPIEPNLASRTNRRLETACFPPARQRDRHTVSSRTLRRHRKR